MNKTLVNIIIFFGLTSCLMAQSHFDRYFEDKSMRVDLVLAGNSDEQSAYLLELKQEPYYGGSTTGLIDPFNYGEYRYFILDPLSLDTLYSKGFCTLFEEWRTTEEARQMDKAFFQTVTFPYPKNKITFVLESRNRNGSFTTMMKQDIDPRDSNIRIRQAGQYEVAKIINHGDHHQKADLVFIAEGYTLNEMDKFKADVRRHSAYILSQAPYNQHPGQFNIWAVCSPSKDSGPSEPTKNNWKSTATGSAFNTFYIDRYLESTDVRAIRDIAAMAPYDHIVVLVNSKRYGGGGIYNHFSLGTSDHPKALTVMIHELGHGFFGLADEYYTSDVAYQDFFDTTVEPWNPNLSTLVDFDSKWKHQVSPDTPIPTPDDQKYHNKPGAFEGGGYMAEGIYRPMYDCRMKSNEAPGFCPVCVEAGNKMITFITQ